MTMNKMGEYKSWTSGHLIWLFSVWSFSSLPKNKCVRVCSLVSFFLHRISPLIFNPKYMVKLSLSQPSLPVNSFCLLKIFYTYSGIPSSTLYTSKELLQTNPHHTSEEEKSLLSTYRKSLSRILLPQENPVTNIRLFSKVLEFTEDNFL